ncbi:hypothetical protein PCURB6_35200 [Paenibacillus curdlanolyticus]|nr:hypothetical protein PCURB6_35200 [Paenibacillus curdlanolyticus]
MRHGPMNGYPPHPNARQQNQPFPGINEPFGFAGGFPGGGTPGFPAPGLKTTGVSTPNVVETALAPPVETAVTEIVDTSKDKGSLFSLEKLGELKGVVDRLGGIDGILSNVTKVQKIVANVQQMAPLIKVLLGSFKKENKSAQASVEDGDEPIIRRRRRKRRKSNTGKGAAASTTPRRRPRKRTR